MINFFPCSVDVAKGTDLSEGHPCVQKHLEGTQPVGLVLLLDTSAPQQLVNMCLHGAAPRFRYETREGQVERVLFTTCNYACILGEEQRRALRSQGRDESGWVVLIRTGDDVSNSQTPDSLAPSLLLNVQAYICRGVFHRCV